MKDTVFSPSFGNKPTQLIGRDEILSTLLEGLNTSVGDRSRATLILGQRGIGKTVLLLAFAEEARKQGFIVASPTITSKDMLNRIVEKIQEEGESILRKKKAKVSGGNVGFLGFSAGLQFSYEEQETKSFTFKLHKLCKALNKEGYGILILIDEVIANNEYLKELIIAYQEMIGERCNIAIAIAGLPEAISSVLNDHVLTFLNRAIKIQLSTLRINEVQQYYDKSFQKLGIHITEEKREKIAQATQGFPYLMQLIGHNITVYADENGNIKEKDIDLAIQHATDDFKNDICQTTLNALSEKDIVFLQAMSKRKETPIPMKEIVQEMQVTNDYAQLYKKRLVDTGVIYQPKRGFVDFAVPYLKEYLIEMYS